MVEKTTKVTHQVEKTTKAIEVTHLVEKTTKGRATTIKTIRVTK